MTMPFDDATRLAAEALGAHVGRAVQEHVQEFLSRVNEAAAHDRAALADQAQQAVSASERTLQDAVANAREEATREATARLDDASREAVARLETTARDQEGRLLELTQRATYLETELAASQNREAELQTRQAELVERATRLQADLSGHAGRFETELSDRTAGLKTELTDRTRALEADVADRTSRVDALESELAERTRALDAVEADMVARTGRLEADLAERTERLQAEIADRTAQFERLTAERSADSDAATQVHDERRSLASSMEGLVSAFRKLDEGQSLSQLLDVLSGQVAQHASRSAVFVVRGLAPQPGPQANASLQGWAFSGFNGAPLDARSLSVPLDKLPALAEVVRQGGRSNVQTSGFAAADVNPLAFMSLPRLHTGMAVPVLVGGQVAAVVYGDDGVSDQDADRAGSARSESGAGAAIWPETLELLARHAARCLEAQTAIRAARLSASAPPAPVVQPVLVAVPTPVTSASTETRSAEGDSAGESYAEEHARRYARLLISDIRLYNEAAVRAGREHRDLWHRLQPDIARARRSFEDRVAEIPDRERLFDEELIRTLADGDEGLLGFDLSRPARAPERLAV
jgi:hypothetical protein